MAPALPERKGSTSPSQQQACPAHPQHCPSLKHPTQDLSPCSSTPALPLLGRDKENLMQYPRGAGKRHGCPPDPITARDVIKAIKAKAPAVPFRHSPCSESPVTRQHNVIRHPDFPHQELPPTLPHRRCFSPAPSSHHIPRAAHKPKHHSS